MVNEQQVAAQQAATAFARLFEIVARLRAPDGCPWDREQTHLSLRKHLIEEAYEVQEAIEAGTDTHLCEELGDLLLQPVLHAQIAAEEERFDIAVVLNTLSDKLVRRHPHVFGDVQAHDSAQVLANWDAIKQTEKAARTSDNAQKDSSLLDDIPSAQPALSLALEVSKKAARAGFEWPDFASVLDKLHEEIAELDEALEADKSTQASSRAAEELGDLLFTVVNVARWRHIDPELALRDMVRRFRARFIHMEELARQKDENLAELSPQRWDELWNIAKELDSSENQTTAMNE